LSVDEIAARAGKLRDVLRKQIANAEVEIEIAEGRSLVGGGSTPAQSLPTSLLRIASARHSASELESRLRSSATETPVIARIEENRLLIDLRTVSPDQEPSLLKALAAALL